MRKVIIPVLIVAAVGFLTAQFVDTLLALALLLAATVALLSIVESGGARLKMIVTFSLGLVAFFIFVSRHGLAAAPGFSDVLEFRLLAETIHLNIFMFLFGLYVFVNCLSYTGIVGDMAWKVVKLSGGRLTLILIAIVLLTSFLAGIFDGATVASIMGIITLTILLSGGMSSKDIVSVMLLLVVCTNVGGVWFVLGEPTNVLAADKMGISPLFFLRYASPFAAIAVAAACVVAFRIAVRKPKVSKERPEMEVLLEGISLKRVHAGHGNLLETMINLGEIQVKMIGKIEEMIDQGIPDFDAALRAGVPEDVVHHALSINLNSEELSRGLIDYWKARQKNDPMAEIIIGDLLEFVRDEYKKRRRSRAFIFAGAGVLLAALTVHSFFQQLPTWVSTLTAGTAAFIGIDATAKRSILSQSWHDLTEAFFLVPLFGIISLINALGGFELIGKTILTPGGTTIGGLALLFSSGLVSTVADNIAVMDAVTNLMAQSAHWQFFSLAAIVGTALGGFGSPIASVQAIILSTLIRRVSRITFFDWIKRIGLFFLVLAVLYAALLILFNMFSVVPDVPPAGASAHL
jgi:Na+/H+ antiporter NhaD/arsenite permease-like protein